MAYLDQQDSAHLMFCFSWLLLSFKREFQLHEVLRMWDVLLSKHLSFDFSVFVCAAMIDTLRVPIVEGRLKNDEILGVRSPEGVWSTVNFVVLARSSPHPPPPSF
jgi:hypothetical protein